MTFWYRTGLSFPALLLLPLSGLVWLITRIRYRHRNRKPYLFPVLVVGNLTVGGTGKTPTILWLISLLQRHGYRVAVVSRGYRARPDRPYPVTLLPKDTPVQVGDEPKLIQQKTGVTVVIDPNRHRAVQSLEALSPENRPDVVISDDGLQHHAMYRDYEILMIDAQRGFGNGRLLPAGPLRESASRMQTVDMVLAKHAGEYATKWQLSVGQSVVDLAENKSGERLAPQPVNLHSAIGNIDSFRQTAEQLGYRVQQQLSYRDHDCLPIEPILQSDLPVLTTEKDAVKLKSAPDNLYVLPFALDYGHTVAEAILARIKELTDEKSRHHSRTL